MVPQRWSGQVTVLRSARYTRFAFIVRGIE
jgi:hypothetical protein